MEEEAGRKKRLDERAAVLKEARVKAAAEVAAGKERVAKELAAALLEVKSSVGQLAAEIARRVLQVAPRPGAPSREARLSAAADAKSVRAPSWFCCSRPWAHIPPKKAATRTPTAPMP